MGDDLSEGNTRGIATTSVWTAKCKDCEAETRIRRHSNTAKDERHRHGRDSRKEPSANNPTSFEYSDDWTHRLLERGNSRSDRCERHRRAHRAAIQALSVAYIDLQTISAVADPQNPTGPLGGLGPLPTLHRRTSHDVALGQFQMGMTDDDILNLLTGLTKKRVAIVEAGTGTGKSTLMPFRLMNPPPDAILRLNDFGPIIVTEPRKAAATGVARFVGEKMCFDHDPKTCNAHIGPGFPVGYQVSGDRNWDSACQLIYVTDGTMINWVREGRLATMSTVIVDEAHERSENIDIILAQLRDQVSRYQHLRVIVTSATLDKNFFIEYFGGEEVVHYQFIAAQKSFGYGVPLFIGADISDSVIEQGLSVEGPDHMPILRFDGWAEDGPAIDGQAPEKLRAITRRLRELRQQETIPPKDWKNEMPDALAKQIVEIAAGTDFGDILGFLPTAESINTAIEAIKKSLCEKGLDFDVYPLLSTVTPDIRDRAIEARTRGDKRKIVVSSNLAETSLTVKGIRYVVDSGLICQSEWDPKIANGSFPTKPHSQSGLRQRWGRVGRDAPGWVFPLYSLEQFLDLPRNTPPGSTQTNLETFYMKLLAAGLDLDKIKLPANFEHPNVKYDEDARHNLETFNLESERARRALAASGAVDCDGHLTDFGREIERFPGSGIDAMAIMLADQLVCVHEVALALIVLKEGRLVGHSNEIFRVGRDWPNAWRIHAARCHQAFVAGCTDDLDVLVRVFAEWRAQSNPEGWCAKWWLNHEALEEADSAVADLIAPLSAGMKSRVERSVRSELANRARAVITRAMGSLHHHRYAGNRFRRTNSDDTETLELSRTCLVDPGDQIIVLSSFRLPPDRDTGQARAPIISTAIRAVDWLDIGAPGSDEAGFDLVLQASARLRDKNGELFVPQDPVAVLRNNYPVGASFNIRVGEEQSCGDLVVQDITRIAGPFPFPGDPVDSADVESRQNDSLPKKKRKSVSLSGFDPDWDPNTNPTPLVPEEEEAQALVDVTVLEINDELPSGRTGDEPLDQASVPEPRIATPPPFHQLYVRAEGSNILPYSLIRVIVLGYQLARDETPILLVDVLTEQRELDPAQHSDLRYGDSVEVVVKGIINDHEDEFLQLARADGKGHFYLESSTRGVDVNDRSFVGRLRSGAKLKALVIPGWRNDPVTVTLLPCAVEHIDKAAGEQHNLERKKSKFLPATIIEEANKWNKIIVELDHRDESMGLVHRFEVKQKKLLDWDVIIPEKGQRILVGLQTDYDRKYRYTLPGNEQCLALAKQNESYLNAKDGKICHTANRVSESLVCELLGMESSKAWERAVWHFYADSFHLDVAAVRPITCHSQLQAPNEAILLLTNRKKFFEKRHRISILTDYGSDTVDISGTDPQAIQTAKEEIQCLVTGSEICAVVSDWAIDPRTKQTYGVFVHTRYERGLLHISNIAKDHFPSEAISTAFPIGAPILVNIQPFDKKRLSLGLITLWQTDGSTIQGRFSNKPDTTEDFLKPSNTGDWSQLETLATAFTIDHLDVWTAISGLDLTTADKLGLETALKLVEYKDSVVAGLQLKRAVLLFESLTERLFQGITSTDLSSTLPMLLKEASRNMSRKDLDRWLSDLSSQIDHATRVLDEKLNEIQKAYTANQSLVRETQEVLISLKNATVVPVESTTIDPMPVISQQLLTLPGANASSAVPFSELSSPPLNFAKYTFVLQGPYGFQRTYYDSVTLSRRHLTGAAPRDSLRPLSGTGLKLHGSDKGVFARMLQNCPSCVIDGLPLEVGVTTELKPGFHKLQLVDIELDLNIILSSI